MFLTPVLGCVGMGILWALGLVSFIVTVLVMTPTAPDIKTDGIVVLTGGADRVRTGLELLKSGGARELLISGVHKTADLKDLITMAHIPDTDLPCCITLGFKALDTAGNADETAAWARQHKLTSLRLVTARYHMPRALIEIKKAIPGVTIIPHPVSPSGFDPLSRTGIILLFSEYHKTIIVAGKEIVSAINKLQETVL